jgi:hypothetical protein
MRGSVPVIAALGVVVAACVPPVGSRPFVGELPKDARLDMTGTFSVAPDGEIRLALAKPCIVMRDVKTSAALVEAKCGPTTLSAISVVARAPWGQDVPGTWSDASHVAFRLDWKSVELDPLADDAQATVERPWLVSGTTWTPAPAEAAAILKQVGLASETETDLVRGGAAPKLEVSKFTVEGDALHVGDPNTLVVAIANRGTGPAYRVVATLRSSISALHGRRLSFGMIKPGAEKVRKVQVTVPGTETAHDTMLVLAIAEGNGAAPGNVNHRVAIAPSTAAPVLAVQCTSGDRKLARPDLDAGQTLKLRCTIENTGNADAKRVELELAVAGGKPSRSAPQAVAAAGKFAFDVPVLVPRSLPINAPVEIAITVRDRDSGRSARTTITGVVRKPKLCTPGALTQAQYQAKIADLRAALAASALTQQEYDSYDAELINCLK